MTLTSQTELEQIFDKIRDFNRDFPGMRFLQMMQLFLFTHLTAEDFYLENKAFMNLIDEQRNSNMNILREEISRIKEIKNDKSKKTQKKAR